MSSLGHLGITLTVDQAKFQQGLAHAENRAKNLGFHRLSLYRIGI